MTDGVRAFAWRTVLALVALLVAWTLFQGPGERVRAGSSLVEHTDHRNECIAGCDPAKHICCSVERQSLNP